VPTTVRPPAPPAATVADLVAYWSEVRENGPLAPATATAYLGAIARILRGQGVTAATPLDALDLTALIAAHAAAHPNLRPSTAASISAQLRAAVNGYRTRHQPDPASPFTAPAPEAGTTSIRPWYEPEGDSADTGGQEKTREKDLVEQNNHDADGFDGTLAHLGRFVEHARHSGLFGAKSTSLYAGAVRRILADQPHLAPVPAAEADLETIIKQFAAENPQLKPVTIGSYRTRLARVIAAYTAYLDEPVEKKPARATESQPIAMSIAVPLPGERSIHFSAPADLTDAEATAASALLRLHYRALAAARPEPGTWTLVFWPEQPEAAHLTGPTFRRALADYIRDRCPHLANRDDAAAIDAWYATEVFVILALDGHHEARDSATLL
jgi:hypothetical protein